MAPLTQTIRHTPFQKRLPQELRLAGTTDMAEVNRFLKDVYLPAHNARFAVPAADQGSAFSPLPAPLTRSRVSRKSAPSPTTTPYATAAAACRSRPTVIAITTSRPGFGCTNIPAERWPSSTVRVARPDTTATAHRSTSKLGKPRDQLRRDRQKAPWTSGQPLRA